MIRKSEAKNKIAVARSIIEVIPNCHPTAAINPKEATITPIQHATCQGELRNFGIIGLLMATNTYEGRNIPRVATRAPGRPPSK